MGKYKNNSGPSLLAFIFWAWVISWVVRLVFKAISGDKKLDNTPVIIAFFIAVLFIMFYLLYKTEKENKIDSEDSNFNDLNKEPKTKLSCIPAQSIRTYKQGGYIINNTSFVDILFFTEAGDVNRFYKTKESENFNQILFDKSLRRTCFATENRGHYDINNIANEILITFTSSKDNRFMRCTLGELGLLNVKYFIATSNQKIEMVNLEYHFSSELIYWIENIPSPNLKKKIIFT